MIVCTTAKDLSRVLASSGRACCFVPTMGALHAGHGALIKQGAALASTRALADGCVVSIFVNPTQFNDAQDFAKYPKTLEADLALCEQAGASVVYAPQASDVYPQVVGDTARDPALLPAALPAVATQPGLEDAKRPGHFAGVYQVVKRLFAIVNPRIAVFGEKDWQQLAVIRAMVVQEKLPIEIISSATVREASGLAMSSRNTRLAVEHMPAALSLSQALCDASACDTPAHAEARMHEVLSRAGAAIEYAVVRDAIALMPLSPSQPFPPARALIAAVVGGVRLIDNSPWTPGNTERKSKDEKGKDKRR